MHCPTIRNRCARRYLARLGVIRAGRRLAGGRPGAQLWARCSSPIAVPLFETRQAEPTGGTAARQHRPDPATTFQVPRPATSPSGTRRRGHFSAPGGITPAAPLSRPAAGTSGCGQLAPPPGVRGARSAPAMDLHHPYPTKKSAAHAECSSSASPPDRVSARKPPCPPNPARPRRPRGGAQLPTHSPVDLPPRSIPSHPSILETATTSPVSAPAFKIMPPKRQPGGAGAAVLKRNATIHGQAAAPGSPRTHFGALTRGPAGYLDAGWQCPADPTSHPALVRQAARPLSSCPPS